ncbi:MAG: toll/interleukin-1 receptor domain-containing protein [Acidobacteria bacterium]|nr:toll/interleukin-1 receptor domain-containing protein [Acidobacteriota bacterium]
MNAKREGIFVSYARKDGEPTAVGLRRLLTEEKFTVWQDRVSLEGGRDLNSKVLDIDRSLVRIQTRLHRRGSHRRAIPRTAG